MAKKTDTKDKRKDEKKKKKKSTGDVVWDNVKAILWAALFAIIIKTAIAGTYKVPTGSMEDTILVGDFLIANKFLYGARIPLTDWRLPHIREPKPGDIIVFKFPRNLNQNYIKRCVAGPGQIVEIIDKELYVDGKRFPDPPYSKFMRPVMERPSDGRDTPDNFGPYKVPRNHYFMMGDNRDNSQDSRFWGPVHEDLILGKAFIIHWSWQPDEEAPEAQLSDPLSVPRLFLYNIFNFPERVRWDRLFTILK